MTAGMRQADAEAPGRPPWLALIAAAAGAGAVHLAQGPVHVEELGTLGLGFYLAAALQLGWAAGAIGALVARPAGLPARHRAALTVSGVAINVPILAAWAVSRVAGLPAGSAPWTPEAIGLADAITVVLEMAVVAGLVGIARRRAVPRLGPVRALSTSGAAIAILLIVAGTAVALGAPAGSHPHPQGDHAQPAEPVEADGHHGDPHEGDPRDRDSHHGDVDGGDDEHHDEAPHS
jgi:hypothetical protein